MKEKLGDELFKTMKKQYRQITAPKGAFFTEFLRWRNKTTNTGFLPTF